MLFVHGHTFVKYKEKYYTTGSLTTKLFNRYKENFEEITVFATVIETTDQQNKYIKAENLVENVKFELVNKSRKLSTIISNNRKLKKKIIEHDHIIMRMPSLYGVLAVRITNSLNKKYLVELVGCPWDAYWNHSFIGKLTAPFMYLITKKIVRKSPYVLYVTNEFLQNRYPNNFRSMGCSDVLLDSHSDNILNARLDAIEHLNYREKVIIGTAGRVDLKYKGHEYVIKAISQLNKKGYNFEYHIAGGGNSSFLRAETIKYGVEKNVKFLGSLNTGEIYNFYDNINIYIQPSKTEGLPRALVEAMSRGCPAIGSKVGGIPELINKKWVFKKGNSRELQEILINMNKDKMKEESIRNFKKASEYNKDYLNEKRTKFYRKFYLGD